MSDDKESRPNRESDLRPLEKMFPASGIIPGSLHGGAASDCGIMPQKQVRVYGSSQHSPRPVALGQLISGAAGKGSAMTQSQTATVRVRRRRSQRRNDRTN
ncbi:hypothetical protein CKO51_16500 [Rhodopirellula sp. SM50]|nr:hypothetical protein CKO51_16500 [Rhodopirellula sp. SM50]